jgi:hypothetical protein
MAEAQDKGFLEPALRPPQDSPVRGAFEARWKRLMDCVQGRTPDRLPVALYATFWLAKYGGISCKDLMYDYEKTKDLAERAALEMDPDVVAPNLTAGTIWGPSLEALGFKQLQWPGHGVGDHQPYQYLDREYMLGEEYEEFLFDPTAFYLRKYLPRIGGVLEGLADMPYLPGMHYFRLISGLRGFAHPQVRESLEKLFKAAEEAERMAAHNAEFVSRITARGYPRDAGSSTGAPYDVLADYFRGARGMMTDLFRNRDRLLALLDKMRVVLTKMTIDNARAAGHPIVMIPIHWAPDAFMSEKQFKEFYWPTFRQMMLDMIDAGLIPMPLWEADCSKRLEIIADIPKNKAIYWFERTDLVKAHEVLGDTVCLRGNLSSSLLTTGTPDEVDAAVRHLVQNVFNRGGRLLLDAAFGLPDETPVENARAMFAAARKYAG